MCVLLSPIPYDQATLISLKWWTSPVFPCLKPFNGFMLPVGRNGGPPLSELACISSLLACHCCTNPTDLSILYKHHSLLPLLYAGTFLLTKWLIYSCLVRLSLSTSSWRERSWATYPHPFCNDAPPLCSALFYNSSSYPAFFLLRGP